MSRKSKEGRWIPTLLQKETEMPGPKSEPRARVNGKVVEGKTALARAGVQSRTGMNYEAGSGKGKKPEVVVEESE